MQELPDGRYDNSPERMRDEKLNRIARLIGGYIGNVVRQTGFENFLVIVQPDEFPTEVWSAVVATRYGKTDRRIRRDPYLSFAFPLLLGEDPSAIYGQILARSPAIALYATGDFGYAQAVGKYLGQQAEHQDSPIK